MRTFKLRGVRLGEGTPKICVPLTGRSITELEEEINLLKGTGADLAEWRADFFVAAMLGDAQGAAGAVPGPERDASKAVPTGEAGAAGFGHGHGAAPTWPGRMTEGCICAVLETLAHIRSLLGDIPVLFTLRTKAEGGEVDLGGEYGNAGPGAAPAHEPAHEPVHENEAGGNSGCEAVRRAIPDSGGLKVGGDSRAGGDYAAVLLAVVRSGLADAVDVELGAGEDTVRALVGEAHGRILVVASSHDFARTPDGAELLSRLVKMVELGADIPKIAAMPADFGDVLTLMSAADTFYKKENRPLIAMSMGDIGKISRVAGGMFGSCLTFGTAKNASAPGQMAVGALREAMRFF